MFFYLEQSKYLFFFNIYIYYLGLRLSLVEIVNEFYVVDIFCRFEFWEEKWQMVGLVYQICEL